MIDPATGVALVMLTSLIVYAWFGGADFGAGVWDLLATGPRAERQRDAIAHAIGPVWEANHVWLILIVVLLFTGFPPVFSAVMTLLHVPLSLMLVGIVIRGSAFTFRSYDTTVGRRRWNRAFSIPSVLTPILLGCVIGAIATGRLDASGNRRLDPWYGPFPLAVGLWTLAIFAFLAATYLTLESPDHDLREDFRLRALASGVAVGVLAWVIYSLAGSHAPRVYEGLQERGWGFALRVATGVFAVLALGSLGTRRYQVARAAVMLQVALILAGCALAQAPYLLPPDLTIAAAAAPPIVHKLLLWVLALGSIVLVPSLYALFRVFKAHTITPWPSRVGVDEPEGS